MFLAVCQDCSNNFALGMFVGAVLVAVVVFAILKIRS